MKIRTVKFLKDELERFIDVSKKHYADCSICQSPGEFGDNCTQYDTWMSELHNLQVEINHKEKLFQQELKERE